MQRSRPLQGCVAWGETPDETLKSLLAVAQTIIQVCKEDGQGLPPDLTPLHPLRRHLNSNRVTYRDLRAKLESLGCRFRRQADGSRETWLNPRNVGKPRQRAAGDHPQAQQS